MPTSGRAFSHAAFGPVLLMTLGILFAIENGSGLSFSRTWPVLIIVAGLWKLLEFAASQRDQSGSSGPQTPGAQS